MTYRELDTKVYTDFADAEANKECAYEIWEAAADAYWAAESKAKAAWDAIPAGDKKDSAEINANDMWGDENLFSDANKLAWYLAAVSTYDIL